ncbi:MAG: RecX family transcriptional regulator [Chlamydiota bacterium]
MKLTESVLSWEAHPEDPKFLILTVDGVFWKEVYKTLFQRHLPNLRRALNLEESFILLEYKLCKVEAFRLLAVKGRFRKELKEKLFLKKFSEEAVFAIVQECQRLGAVNDEEEGALLVRRLQKKGYGKAFIVAKMRSKGVSLSADLMESQVPIIRQLLEKKYRNHTREKAITALCRRGFDYATIIDALNSTDFYKKEKG